MPDDTKTLLDRLVGGDPAARGAVLARSETDRSPALLVAAALVAPDPHALLARAATHATTTRDRQLVAIAAADVAGDRDLLDALVRDHLADHPDNVLAAWIAARRPSVEPTRQEPAMTAPQQTSPARPDRRPVAPGTRRGVIRWLVTFAGFPLGGLLARILVGPADSASAAVLGGLVTGLVLGAVQAWGLRLPRTPALRWAGATAVGFGAGLGAGAAVVGYATTPAALLVQGAVCGLAVGLAQAAVLRPLVGTAALGWPVALAVAWPAGWAVTTAFGVRVDEHFTVFGSSGALVVTALTVVLPLALRRHAATS